MAKYISGGKLERDVPLASRKQKLAADIEKGLSDLAMDRVCEFEPDRIIERGKRLLASRWRTSQ